MCGCRRTPNARAANAKRRSYTLSTAANAAAEVPARCYTCAHTRTSLVCYRDHSINCYKYTASCAFYLLLFFFFFPLSTLCTRPRLVNFTERIISVPPPPLSVWVYIYNIQYVCVRMGIIIAISCRRRRTHSFACGGGLKSQTPRPWSQLSSTSLQQHNAGSTSTAASNRKTFTAGIFQKFIGRQSTEFVSPSAGISKKIYII